MAGSSDDRQCAGRTRRVRIPITGYRILGCHVFALRPRPSACTGGRRASRDTLLTRRPQLRTPRRALRRRLHTPASVDRGACSVEQGVCSVEQGVCSVEQGVCSVGERAHENDRGRSGSRASNSRPSGSTQPKRVIRPSCQVNVIGAGERILSQTPRISPRGTGASGQYDLSDRSTARGAGQSAASC